MGRDTRKEREKTSKGEWARTKPRKSRDEVAAKGGRSMEQEEMSF